MDAFSYLSVLISIILALGMTRVLAGVGEMLQARSRRRLYWVHLLWVVNLFLYLVVAWWIFTAGATSNRGHFSSSFSSLSRRRFCFLPRSSFSHAKAASTNRSPTK